MDFFNKELVESFSYSTLNCDRRILSHGIKLTETINGIVYTGYAQRTGTTVVADLYKLDNPSNELFNYVLLVGVSYQDQDDFDANADDELEVAAIRAKVTPQHVMYFKDRITESDFYNFVHFITRANKTPMLPKKSVNKFTDAEKQQALDYAFEKYEK